MFRPFRQRIAVLGLIGLCFLAVYGAGVHFSPMMVTYVVGQALIQKAPDGISTVTVRARYEAFLAAAPPAARLAKVMALSNYLEKVQKLTPTELDRLLTPDGNAEGTGI
jgi:hypothetical protein